MKTLYDLSAEYAYALNAIADAEDGEDITALYDKLDALDTDIDRKADAYAKIIKNSETEAEGYAQEIKRLQRHKKTCENIAENLRNRLNYAMVITGKDKIHTSIGQWALQFNPPSVTVLNAAEIPAEYWKQPEPVLDKTKIINEWRKTGCSVPGALVSKLKGLRFK